MFTEKQKKPGVSKKDWRGQDGKVQDEEWCQRRQKGGGKQAEYDPGWWDGHEQKKPGVSKKDRSGQDGNVQDEAWCQWRQNGGEQQAEHDPGWWDWHEGCGWNVQGQWKKTLWNDHGWQNYDSQAGDCRWLCSRDTWTNRQKNSESDAERKVDEMRSKWTSHQNGSGTSNQGADQLSGQSPKRVRSSHLSISSLSTAYSENADQGTDPGGASPRAPEHVVSMPFAMDEQILAAHSEDVEKTSTLPGEDNDADAQLICAQKSILQGLLGRCKGGQQDSFNALVYTEDFLSIEEKDKKFCVGDEKRYKRFL